MKKLLFSLFFVLISTVQTSFAQCDLDFTFVNTGSNMTVFFTPPTAAALASELGEGTIGAFFLNDSDVYYCASSSSMSGIPQQLAVMGDDATTTDIQDGFNANQELLWFYESNDGNVYSLTLSPAETYTTNGNIAITAFVASNVDCNDTGGSNSSSCDYNFEFTNTGSNMTVFFTPTTASAMNAEMGTGTIGAFFLNDSDVYICSGSSSFSGDQIALPVMGDDATTNDLQDGFTANEEMLWFYESNDGSVYSLSLSPASTYSTNETTFIMAYVATLVDCGSADVPGCTDVTACNYNVLATSDDATCTYADTNLDCTGECLNDSDTDGICDENEIVGCQDEMADNYNAAATDSGDCIFSGCSDYTACNYNENANADDGTCVYTDGVCESCEDGILIDNDVDNDGICNADEVEECTDATACNYNDDDTSISDNTLCIYAEGCDSCSGDTDGSGTLVNNDADNDGVCNDLEIVGCTQENACNYDSTATDEAGNCEFSALYYNCLGVCSNDEDNDAICDENEVPGCTDDTAINFNDLATDDDGSCEYETTECVLPNSYVVNTGTNMTLMLLPSFISSLNVENTDAYIVALTDAGLVVGSTLVHEDELEQGQVAIALWGDDPTTISIIDGATEGENIILQLVDGVNLYTISLPSTISFTANGVGAVPTPVSPAFSCSGEIAGILGCTNMDACNYTEQSTEDDGSCIFEEIGYNCNGVCVDDVDNDGICDGFEIPGCTDETALNYNELATDDNDSCEYPLPVEGCTDPEANNYNELANIEDDSCLYGSGGCTYMEATNYDPEATFEVNSCVFDIPFIYITNTIDGDILTNSLVSFNFEVVNMSISTLSSEAHINYSVDGGAYGTLFDQSGLITQDFSYGEHTIQFIIFDNVSGNNQAWSPAIETTINFTVGVEGCMNELAGNYNPFAVIDDNSCVPGADVEFFSENTGSNHTLMVLLSEFGSIDVNGFTSQDGDLLGVFYEYNNSYYGAGYATLGAGNIQVAAWGDDVTTDEQNGFIEGQTIIWAIQFAQTGNTVFLEAIYGSGPDSYSTNGLSTIIGFEVMEFENISGCIDSDYVEYNPFAQIDDDSCLTLKIYGCTEDNFLEYWVYNEDLLSIELPEVLANTNDGSCFTGIVDGCTNTDYLEYCLSCNVSDNSVCENLVIFGCIDPLALNFDELANTDNGTCEFDICIEFELANFEIIHSSNFNLPVLSYEITNLSNEQIILPTFNLNLASSEYISVSTSLITNSIINPNATILVEAFITSDLSTLPFSVALTGSVNLQGESFDSGDINCDFAFEEYYIFTTHIGCTYPNSYNYNALATVDDGSCIDLIQASVSVFNPNCSDQFGYLSMFITGGIPPYSTPTTYTQHYQFGPPVDNTPVVIDDNQTITMYGLDEGDYSIEVHDSVGNIEFYEFSVLMPEEVIVQANITNSLLLTSTIVQGNGVVYQWLYEGETIPGANSSIHYAEEVGEYQVYIESPNGCGAYSNTVYLNTVGIRDLESSSFNIYPNPANNFLSIQLSQLLDIASLTITDILGQELILQDFDTRNVSKEFKIDLSSIPTGIYFVVVESGTQQIVKKFVKN